VGAFEVANLHPLPAFLRGGIHITKDSLGSQVVTA
jgi:hypothetical protein